MRSKGLITWKGSKIFRKRAGKSGEELLGKRKKDLFSGGFSADGAG